MEVSNCCGDPGTKIIWYDDITYKDVEMCGKCGEHCVYLEEMDFEITDNKITEDGINGNTTTEIRGGE